MFAMRVFVRQREADYFFFCFNLESRWTHSDPRQRPPGPSTFEKKPEWNLNRAVFTVQTASSQSHPTEGQVKYYINMNNY